MRAKTSLFVVAAVVLLMVVLAVAGCGGGAGGASSIKGKAVLEAALGDFDLSAGAVTAALSAGKDGTVAAELKTAEQDMNAKWSKVVAAAKDMGWADADSGTEAMKNVQKAIDSLPAAATVAQADTAIKSSMEGLMEMEAELWALVQSAQ